MRRDHPDALALQRAAALPAAPDEVVEALGPLLTDQRLARIEAVLAARKRAVIPVLDGLIDPHNIAAVLRSADAFGVQEVHLIAGELDFLASRRVAQGTERWVDVVEHPDRRGALSQLRARGYEVFVATMDGALTPEELARRPRVAIVFGNEHAGVDPEAAALADGSYRIPMCGFVESLNVSVAAALTLRAAVKDRPGDLDADDAMTLRARFMMQSVDRAEEIVAEQRHRAARRVRAGQVP